MSEIRVLFVALLLTGCVSASSSFRRVESSVRERLGDERNELLLGDGSIEGDERDGDGDERLTSLLEGPVGPEEAVAITLLASPEVRGALEELGIARAEVLRAGAPPNPELDSETRLGGTGDESEAHVVIDLAELIVVPLRRAAAETELRAAELEAADAVLMLGLSARNALISAQLAEARRALLSSVVDVTRAAWRTAVALHEAGNVPLILPATEEAMHQDARLMLARAELEALEARETAVVAMGLSGIHARYNLAEGLALPEAEAPVLSELEERAVARSLRLAAIEESMRALGGRHEASRVRGLLPELRAGVSGSYADQAFAFGPAFTVTLPILNQGLGESDGLEAELRVMAERWTAEAIRLRSMVRRARNRVLSYRAQALFCESELLPARRRVLEQTLLQYNAMAATPFALLSARRAELEAGLTCLDARADHAMAQAALDQLVAGGWVELGAPSSPGSPGSATRPPSGEEH